MCLTAEEAQSCAEYFERNWSVNLTRRDAQAVGAFISHLAGRVVMTDDVLDLLFAAENVRRERDDLDSLALTTWQRHRAQARLADAQTDLETKARIVAGEATHVAA